MPCVTNCWRPRNYAKMPRNQYQISGLLNACRLRDATLAVGQSVCRVCGWLDTRQSVSQLVRTSTNPSVHAMSSCMRRLLRTVVKGGSHTVGLVSDCTGLRTTGGNVKGYRKYENKLLKVKCRRLQTSQSGVSSSFTDGFRYCTDAELFPKPNFVNDLFVYLWTLDNGL